jgi:hypothetical protein
MLCLAEGARVAFPITTNSADVMPTLVGEENVGAEIDMLSGAFQAAAGKRQSGKIDCLVDRDENIGVMWNWLCRC